ncbi:sensor histidine kinase [Streptomyces sp. GbtcB6]|uniref:sensor histidine kinase n=1 Tax=Streptomyces sp. GbtcB6 TaxID=2824751 RepID=UPI0020C5F0CF|nr:histidine kinase [Streptomyces sp. GbtcB6]
MKALDVREDIRKHLGAAGMWPRRRIVGETVLALVLALFTAVNLPDGSVPRAVAVAVAVVVAVLLRRAFPGSVLVFTAALAGVLGAFWLLLMVVSWSAGSRIEAPRRALTLFAVSYVLYAGLSVQQAAFPLSAPQTLLFATLGFLAAVVVPGLASRYRAQRHRLLRALHEQNAQLLREREIIASHARLRERQRIAQDMHDSLGHQLALIAVHTGALEVDRGLTDGQREVVGVLRKASVTAMHELREAVGILHDGTPDRAREREDAPETVTRGAAGIDALVAAARGTRAVVELRCTGEARPLAPAADHAAYRIVQEALTNALKHAPGAPVTVALRYEPDSLVVEVANGPVPAPAEDAGQTVVSGGQGLTGLQERARLIGGLVHAGATADGGFRIAGVLPYPGREMATFVDTADDFRGQSGGQVPGDGGDLIDWSGPPDRQKEFDIAMGSRKKGLWIGCGGALLAFVVLGGLAVVFIVKLVGDEADKLMLDPSVYASVRVGDTEAAVRDKLPHGRSFLARALDSDHGSPPVPRGATCSSYLSSGDWPDEGGKAPAYRFCFRDGRLIEKRTFMSTS